MSAVSSAVSPVVSSVVASATLTSASCATADFTEFPTDDVACAVVSTSSIASNTSDVFDQCCKSAPVEQWHGDCGYYCLSVQQSVNDLRVCFMGNGINPASIMCNSNNTATATGTPTRGASSTASATSAGASGRASGSASGTGSGAGASGSPGAAAGLVVPQVSNAGLGLLGMIVASTFAGAML